MVSWDLPDAIADAHLVHIHQAYTRCSEMGLLVARQQHKPICITDHGGFTSPLGTEIGSLELADRVIAYSEFGASLYRTRTPITIIKGGVDASLFHPPSVRPPRDRVLYVGRLLPHKGIDLLIEALPPELPLTVCGRPYHDAYFQRLQALAAGKQVAFVTDASDQTIREFYARSWATVLPSVFRDCYGTIHREPELMGFTLLESMACGTPAIANRTAAMPEFIQHGQTGLIFESPDELTGQLQFLASHPDDVEEMGQKARRAVEQEYDLKVAGAKLHAVYEELIGKGRQEIAA